MALPEATKWNERLNILFLAFGHEGNTFNSDVTVSDDFRVRTDDFVSKSLRRAANNLGVHIVPVIHCWAPPGGPIEFDSYRNLIALVRQEFQRALSETPQVDAVLLHLHGAMAVKEGAVKCGTTSEVDLVRELKALAGETVPFAAAFDLHGNLSADMVAYLDVLRSYRTAPHEDVTSTLVEVLRQLHRILDGGIVTSRGFVKIPLLIPEVYAITAREPLVSLMERGASIEETSGILSASIFTGFSWADSSTAGASVVVIGEDSRLVSSATISLSQDLWNFREDIFNDLTIYSPGDTIKVVAATGGYICVLDSGDNIGAGASGERIDILQSFLSNGVKACLFAPIVDEKVYRNALELGPGRTIFSRLGERISELGGVKITGMVKAVKEGSHVLLDVNGIDILVTAKRTRSDSLTQLEQFGINLDQYRIVVFKLGYLSAELYRRSSRVIVVASDGCTTLALEKLNFQNLRRPVFPLDTGVEFDAQEAIVIV